MGKWHTRIRPDIFARSQQDRVARGDIPFHRTPKPRVDIRLAFRYQAKL